MKKQNSFKMDAGLTGFRFPLILGGILLIFFSFSMLSADNYYPPRVSYIEGGVSYESAGDVDWTTATLNLPIFRGDRLFAKPGAKTELEFGLNSFLRMDENTDVVFTHLSEKAASINLTLGSIIIRAGKSFRMDVQTRVGMVQLRNDGLYRIDTDESGLTRIIVKKGRAEVVDGSEKLKIEDGQMSTIGGDPSLQQAAFGSYEDDFDLWSGRRDALFASSKSVEYVGNYYPGVYTLDDYGYWRTYSGLGRVWVPRVGAGWAPYRSGLWLDFSVGWTWLSYEPWGWLPYHYGYWHYYEPYNHWVWSPGFYGTSYTHFGAWSPNCVNFYYGNGYVGWSPRPWGYGTRPNTIINNTTVIINNNSSRGMTVVKATDFSRRRVETTMVNNVPDTVRSSFKAGLPEDISRTSRNSLAARNAALTGTSRGDNGAAAPAGSREAVSTKAGSSGLNRDIPTQSRSAEFKDSRGSAATVSGERGSSVSTRSAVATRERSDAAPGTSSRVTPARESGLSSGRVTTIPSRGSSAPGGAAKAGSSSQSGTMTRERTTTAPGSPNGNTWMNSSSRLSSSSVEAIPSAGESYSRYSRSGYSSGNDSGNSMAASDSRIRSMTGTNVQPRISTDSTPSRTAARTYTDQSSKPGFWGRVFGSSSSSSRSSGSNGSYTSSRSSSGSSRSYGSTSSRPSSVSRPSSTSRPSSISRPSSVSRPSSSSRPSSRPKRP